MYAVTLTYAMERIQHFGSKELRQHLVTCFENCCMLQFPTTTIRKNTVIKELNFYYKHRLPYVSEHLKHSTGKELTCMVECYIFVTILFLCGPYCRRCQEKKSGAVTTGVVIQFLGTLTLTKLEKSYPSPPVTPRKVLY